MYYFIQLFDLCKCVLVHSSTCAHSVVNFYYNICYLYDYTFHVLPCNVIIKLCYSAEVLDQKNCTYSEKQVTY